MIIGLLTYQIAKEQTYFNLFEMSCAEEVPGSPEWERYRERVEHHRSNIKALKKEIEFMKGLNFKKRE